MAGDDAHHLLHVLRAEIGSTAEITDACGRTYLCALREASGDSAVFSVEEELALVRELPCRITLYPCLAKSDKMAMIVQKATELGVGRIIPVISARTVARPDEKGAAHKRARWAKIAEAAAKQCGRTKIPEIGPILPIEEAAQQAGEDEFFLLPYECAEDKGETKEILVEAGKAKSLSLIIGPEGGFTAEEVVMAKARQARVITLGNRILRAETAAITALSWLVYQMEIER